MNETLLKWALAECQLANRMFASGPISTNLIYALEAALGQHQSKQLTDEEIEVLFPFKGY